MCDILRVGLFNGVNGHEFELASDIFFALVINLRVFYKFSRSLLR